MKISRVLLSVSVLGIIAITSLSTSAMAWHPKGIIVKSVQNITAGSALKNADTASQAVAAKPGDILRYVIEVKNDGNPDNKGLNDMATTVMTDNLPAGVELVSSPSVRHISENLGTIKPGHNVTKEYTVKVTAQSSGLIENTACFTGNSTVHDNAQHGCNSAFVNITVPPTPTPIPTPVIPVSQPPAPTATVTPVELPHTGMTENILGSAFTIGIAWYAIHRYVISRRELTQAFHS